ncbi:MAG: hypothetical protein WAN35_16855 [Terracidiphilus sp.]
MCTGRLTVGGLVGCAVNLAEQNKAKTIAEALGTRLAANPASTEIQIPPRLRECSPHRADSAICPHILSLVKSKAGANGKQEPQMTVTNFPDKGRQAKRKSDGLIGQVFNSKPKLNLITIRWRKGPGFEAVVCTSEQFFHDWELIEKKAPVPRGYLAIFILPVIFGILFYFWIESREPEPSKTEDLTQGLDVSQSPEKFIECINNNDDGSKSDSTINEECSREASAWIKNCQKTGGGDKQKCADKSMAYLKMIRFEKEKMRKQMR